MKSTPRRKVIGVPSKRFTVYRFVSQWDGNTRREVWEIAYESYLSEDAYKWYTGQTSGYWQLHDNCRQGDTWVSGTV